jgi:hypothetical protein
MSALAPYDDDAEGWAEVGAEIVSDIKAALERRDFNSQAAAFLPQVSQAQLPSKVQ